MPATETVTVRNILNPSPRLIGRPHFFEWEVRQGERVLASGTAETAREAHRAAREAAGKGRRREAPPSTPQGA